MIKRVRVNQAMAILSLGLVTSVAFQNCASFESADNPLYDQASESVCIGLACGMDTTHIKLSIANDTITVKSTSSMPADCAGNNSRCVDVGGYCDDGGFPNNEIFASLTGGTVNRPTEFSTSARCIDGRYAAQVRLPDGYDYANMHTLRLTLYSFDGVSTTRYKNETGSNYRDVVILGY